MVLHCPKATQDRETLTFFGLDDEPVRRKAGIESVPVHARSDIRPG